MTTSYNHYATFLHAPMPVAILRGPELIFEFSNHANQRYFKNRNLIGMRAEDVPELPKQHLEILREVFSTGNTVIKKAWPTEFEIQHKKVLHYIDVIFGPIFNDLGEVDGLMVTGVDVTETVLSQKRALERESQLKRITDSLPAMISYVNRDHIYTYVNKQYEIAFGLAEDQIIGKHVREIVGESGYKKVSYYLDAALQNEKIEFETQVEYTYGKTIVHVSYLPDIDETERVIGIFVLIRDIFQERNALNRLAQSEEQFRTIFNTAAIGMGQSDPNTGRLIRVNKKLCEITGYSEAELLKLSWFDYTHPDDLSRDSAKYQQLVKGEISEFTTQKRYIHKRGHILWVSVSVGLMRDLDGKSFTTVASIQDITEVKEVERKLQEAVASREEFLSIASHELKTPLTSLYLQTQMRQRALKDGDLAFFTQERLKKMFEVDIKQVQRLALLIDDMLDLSRISTGKLTINRQLLSLSEVAEDVIERYRNEIEISGSKIRLISEDMGIGNWDRFRIEQVFSNLLSNAVKYASGSEIEIRVYLHEEHFVRVSVQDQGNGIAPENLEKIFMRFERANPKNENSGLGLGLYIVKQILEVHNGRIWVESSLGKGSNFIFELPLG